jgi:hypothetical protein
VRPLHTFGTDMLHTYRLKNDIMKKLIKCRRKWCMTSRWIPLYYFLNSKFVSKYLDHFWLIFPQQKQDSVYTFQSCRRDTDIYVMTLHTLVHISICVNRVNLWVCMFSIIQNMAVCVYRSAIKHAHGIVVLRDVGILHIARWSRRLIYHILARSGDVMHRYIVFMFADLCSFCL